MNKQNEMDEILKEVHGITKEIKIVLKKLSLHNVTIPNIEESEEEEDSINLLGKKNAIKIREIKLFLQFNLTNFCYTGKKLVKLIAFFDRHNR